MEQWREIKGFEKKYEVSNYGNVRNFKNRRTKKFEINHNGYCRVALRKDGKALWKRVHRLVMEAFSDDYREDLHVNHKDFNKLNNHIDNLEMVSYEENLKHFLEYGDTSTLRKSKKTNKPTTKPKARKGRQGVKHHNAKINDEIAKYIYDISQLHSRDLVTEMIKEKYGIVISKWVVKDIKNKNTWKHIHEEGI